MPRVPRPSAGSLLRSLEPDYSPDAQEQPVFGWALPSSVVLLGTGVKRQVRSSYEASPRLATQAHVRDVLEHFVRLADADHATIRAFVARFGPLRISNEPNADGAFVDENGRTFTTGDGGFRWPIVNELHWFERPVISEPVAVYQKYAQLVVSTISAALRARQGQDLFREDYTILRPFLPTYATETSAALVVAEIVNMWLLTGSSRPMLVWNGRTPVVAWTGGLWGAIGTQLMARVLRDIGPITCANCGSTIRGRKRRPKAGQKSWCTRAECLRVKYRESKAKQRAITASP